MEQNFLDGKKESDGGQKFDAPKASENIEKSELRESGASISETQKTSESILIRQAHFEDEKTISLWLRGRTPHTVRAYERVIGEFVDFLNLLGESFGTCKEEHLIDFVSLKSAKTSTLAQRAAVLKSVFSFGVRIGRLQRNPGLALKIKTPEQFANKALSPEEIEQMIAAQKNPRDLALCSLFYGSGARRDELKKLNWEHCSENADTSASVRLQGKGGKTRVVKISSKVWARVKILRREDTEPGDAVFEVRYAGKWGRISESAIYNTIKGAALRAGIHKKVSPHWMRHSHATNALKNGAPLRLLQQTLGHSSIETTSRYTHMNPEESSGEYLEGDTEVLSPFNLSPYRQP